jgi:hypothetical protein
MRMVPGVESVHDLDRPWAEPRLGPQLRAIRRAAETLRARITSGPRCVAVRTFPLATFPYPTRHAFSGAASSAAPFCLLTHRAVFVQLLQHGQLKNLLFGPTDVERARATPYFARLLGQLAKAPPALVGLAGTKAFPPLEAQLAEEGIAGSDIDYVAFPHFQGQDLRRTVAGADAARFPGATLLAPRREWDDWDDLSPLQRHWFVRDGKAGLSPDAVALTDTDLVLGDGVFLLRTPGVTSGTQTLVLQTSTGVWAVSANGCAADDWSPLESRIRGVAAACRQRDVDVVGNIHSPERQATQHASMVLERTLTDRVARAPGFVQVLPVSELTPSLIAPGLRPTVVQREIRYGEIARPRRSGRPSEPLRSEATP